MAFDGWLALLSIVVLVLLVDWLFRKHFHQRGEPAVGARQRGPQPSWKRPTGEVIDEVTRPDRHA